MKHLSPRLRATMPVEDIPLCKLVPSEPVLEKVRVDAIKIALAKGNATPPPRVSPIGKLYYVHDGNHRIMAMKQLGHEFVSCEIQPHKSSPNVANQDEDDCKKMIKKGYAGFNNIEIGTKAQKMEGYKEEEVEDFIEALEGEEKLVETEQSTTH
jgi:uncharacterized ParB-like nuclease family protein